MISRHRSTCQVARMRCASETTASMHFAAASQAPCVRLHGAAHAPVNGRHASCALRSATWASIREPRSRGTRSQVPQADAAVLKPSELSLIGARTGTTQQACHGTERAAMPLSKPSVQVHIEHDPDGLLRTISS